MELIFHLFFATHGLAALFLIPVIWICGVSVNLANLTCEEITKWEAYRAASKAEAKRLAKIEKTS